MAGNADAAFAYDEPSITTLLSWAGFLLALNLINVALDKLMYCGLIGQLFIGILWGTPGAKWFNQESEAVIRKLGYLGLIMLVYEGGLSTSMKSVKANLLLSICVAITGIGAPIGLSFILQELVSASPIQAFAAGAALSSTSLGTTFTILSSTELITTRLGTVTTTAAMLDDVIGLVMIQVISNLGGTDTSFNPITVIRPVLVSLGFALGILFACAFCLGPIFKRILLAKHRAPDFVTTMQFAFLAQTLILVGVVAGASYAGTSSLFAAYLAGVIISWFDELVAESKETPVPDGSQSEARNPTGSRDKEMPTGAKVYERYHKEPVGRILIPLFFASIGFAIPITEMFQGSVVWRGIIYAFLMAFGKMLTGLWLVRFSCAVPDVMKTFRKPLSHVRYICAGPSCPKSKGHPGEMSKEVNLARSTRPGPSPSPSMNNSTMAHNRGENAALFDSTHNREQQVPTQTTELASTVELPPKPKSLYPPSILGLAMVARGEVGYLIASLAQSQGIFSAGTEETETSDIYLVVIWAITMCTCIGPICVGTLVRRVKKLQGTRGSSGADPLGVWGI